MRWDDGMDSSLSAQDWRTLRMTPMWIFSAFSGRQRNFPAVEVQALWQSVEDAAAGSFGLARQVLASISSDRVGVLAEFELEERPIVSGLCQVVSVLNSRSPQSAVEFTAVMRRLGEGVGRARGPYGQALTRDDAEILSLLGELLDVGVPAGLN